METKLIYNCFGKFGFEEEEPKMGSWNKGIFLFCF